MKPIKWFGLVIGYTVLTLICVYSIPIGSVLSIVRIVLAFVFLALVPGYCLLSVLFEESSLDFAERLVLSVALSFSLEGISGLFLGLSSVGISLESIIETVSAITVVLAVLAFVRKAGLLRLGMQRIRIPRLGAVKERL